MEDRIMADDDKADPYTRTTFTGELEIHSSDANDLACYPGSKGEGKKEPGAHCWCIHLIKEHKPRGV